MNLEKRVLDAEIDVIRQMGVEFRYGCEVGRSVTIDQFRSEGYKAFFIAIGMQAGRSANIPARNLRRAALIFCAARRRITENCSPAGPL